MADTYRTLRNADEEGKPVVIVPDGSSGDDQCFLSVQVASVVIPDGISTEAKQDTQIALLGGTGALKDNGPAWTSKHGIAGVPFTSADASALASVTDAPTAGQKLVITDLIVSVDTAMSVTFQCETSGAVLAGPFYLPANGSMQITPRSKAWKLATADKKLRVITSLAGNIMVDAHYYSEI